MTFPAYTIELDVNDIASALRITPDQCREAFTDGRVISRFSEHWVCSALHFDKHENSNAPSSDASAHGGEFRVSIRSLTKRGIKFQDSKRIGAGRSCTQDELLADIEATDRWAICDIRQFPLVHVYQLRSITIANWARNGELTPSGLTGDKFARLTNAEGQFLFRMLT